MSGIGETLGAVREALRGVATHDVRVLGVTKFQPLERVREAVAAGLDLLGNNYAQDGELLRDALAGARVEWHFIGHIQSRKVKALTSYDCVESLDRLEVATALDARLTSEGRTISCLVEVNVGGEAQKSGIAPEALPAFLEALGKLSRLRVRGLMGMPPPLEPAEARRPFFRALRKLYESHAATYAFDTLSMGTSGDYLVAASEGATLVRLGTTLFGERPPRK